MEESKYITGHISEFQKTFPENWIENLNWSDKAGKRTAFKVGKNTIMSFQESVVSDYLQLALTGDFLIHNVDAIDKFEKIIGDNLPEIVPKDKSLKTKLYVEFQAMLYDLRSIIKLSKSHFKHVRERFEPRDKSTAFNMLFIERDKAGNNNLLSFADLIFDVCALEYEFSYRDSYIRQLFVFKEQIKISQKSINGELNKIASAAIAKIELLLGKLSVFSKKGKIYYDFNFDSSVIQLDKPDNYPEDDFRGLYLRFLDPYTFDKRTINKWYKDSKKPDVKMWQLVFLMRYYTKVLKNEEIVNELIKVADHQHKDYESKDDHNLVNDYADKIFMNYMYNSRFSFRCQYLPKSYSYEKMTKDLSEIETIQEKTMIFNYHPYKKAIDYTIKWIEDKLNDRDNTDNLMPVFYDLLSYFEKYKENIDWCKHNQPYSLQLRYNFSCMEIDGCDWRMYCPSSFCRPLRFQQLDEKRDYYASKIAILEYEITHQESKKELIKAQNKIDNMERKNFEHMGVFISITTFLVGLLSIFIGNSGSVSIFDKMEYVVVLGLIMVIFVCLGYFVVGDILKKAKPWIFLAILVVCSCGLFVFLSKGKCQNSNDANANNVIVSDTVSVAKEPASKDTCILNMPSKQ